MKNVFKILFTLVLILRCPLSFGQMAIEEQSALFDSLLQNWQNPGQQDLVISLLETQIDNKETIIQVLKNQIVQLDKDIFNNELYYERLNSQLDYEKKIYSTMIVKAQRYNSLMHQNFDLFSFENLYKTYRQFLYFKWESDYRKKKIRRIKNIQDEISNVVLELDKSRANKNKLAERLGVEQSFIRKYSQSRSNLINDLRKKTMPESDNISRNNLDSLKYSKISSRETQSDSSVLFQIQKGYLIWPVQKSAIINYYGEKQHPVHEKVTIKNDGLDFLVPTSSKVQCVYNGVVAKITLLPQNKYVIIVRHGTYFTVYNGLDHIKVSVGDEVEKGESIGSFDSEESHCLLNFQIWQGSETLDPYQWLIKLPKK